MRGSRGTEEGEHVIPMDLTSACWLAASMWTVTTSHLWFCGLACEIVPLRLCEHHGLNELNEPFLGMIITFGEGTFKCGMTALASWSLVTVFLADCASPEVWLGPSAPCTGVMLSPRELPAPLLWFRPYFPGTAFPSHPWSVECGKAVAHAGLNKRVPQPARFTRWGKISYLLRFFSPRGWIETCVRMSVALYSVVSS